MFDLDAFDLVHIHLVGLAPDEAFLVDDPPVGDGDLGDPPLEPLLDQENDRNEREGVCVYRQYPGRSRVSLTQ